MRIALFTNEYPPNVYGGAGVHVEYLARELAAAEGGAHRIDVYSFGDQRETRANLRVQGVASPVRFTAQDPRRAKLLDALVAKSTASCLARSLGRASVARVSRGRAPLSLRRAPSCSLSSRRRRS